MEQNEETVDSDDGTGAGGDHGAVQADPLGAADQAARVCGQRPVVSHPDIVS